MLCASYSHLPGVTHLEFSSLIEYKRIFDTLIEDKHNVPEVCSSIIDSIITIFVSASKSNQR